MGIWDKIKNKNDDYKDNSTQPSNSVELEKAISSSYFSPKEIAALTALNKKYKLNEPNTSIKKRLQTDIAKQAKTKFKINPSYNIFIFHGDNNTNFNKTLASVRDQGYENFVITTVQSIQELCFLSKLKNNTTHSLVLIAGDILDNDFLYETTKIINNQSPDVIYYDDAIFETDDIGINIITRSYNIKPDFSIDTLMAYNFIGRIAIITNEVFLPFIHKLNKDDYDNLSFNEFLYTEFHKLFLDCFERNLSFYHSPIAPYKCKIPCVHELSYEKYLECTPRFKTLENKPKVSLIIPTCDNFDLLIQCINSIMKYTTYTNYEIVVVDNQSCDKATLNGFELLKVKYKNVIIANANFKYSIPKSYNFGASQATGDVLIFLSNRIKAISSDIITLLAENALRPKIGVVGPMILTPSHTIDSAGLVVGLKLYAGSLYNGANIDTTSCFLPPTLYRNVSAVKGYCIACSSQLFKSLNGFNESFSKIGFDIEFAVRALNEGYRNIYNPLAQICYYENKTPTYEDTIPFADYEISYKTLKDTLKTSDKYYSQNLKLTTRVPTVR